MYAPTAAGGGGDRPPRARGKITRTSPSVGTTSGKRGAGGARGGGGMRMAGMANNAVAGIGPGTEPGGWAGWAGLARWWVEMLIAARANIAFAVIAPAMQPAIWAGR